MKTTIFLFIAVLLITCNERSVDPSCDQLLIESVFPFKASAGGPVLIKGTGFNDEKLIVRFGTLKADIIEKNGTYISTKVPSGLLGTVELSVTNDLGCVETFDFEVSSGSSNQYPGSPPVYFIPPGGFSFSIQVPSTDIMILRNIYNVDHGFRFFPFREVMIIDDDDNNYEFFGQELNPVRGKLDLVKNEVDLKIDKTGTADEELVGGFYTMKISVKGEVKHDNFLLVFSSVTGAQYIFYREY